MSLGELLWLGQALSEASKIAQTLDSMFEGISALSGEAPVAAATPT